MTSLITICLYDYAAPVGALVVCDNSNTRPAHSAAFLCLTGLFALTCSALLFAAPIVLGRDRGQAKVAMLNELRPTPLPHRIEIHPYSFTAGKLERWDKIRIGS